MFLEGSLPGGACIHILHWSQTFYHQMWCNDHLHRSHKLHCTHCWCKWTFFHYMNCDDKQKSELNQRKDLIMSEADESLWWQLNGDGASFKTYLRRKNKPHNHRRLLHTRCYSPLSESVPAGRPVRCEHMDSLSHWCILLLHLIRGHLGTCIRTYSLCWSVGGQREGESGKKKMLVDLHPMLFELKELAVLTQSMSAVLQLLWHSAPLVPGWAVEQSK